MTTAGAALPVRGTDEYAMPNSDPAVTPSTVTQTNVTHRCQSVGNDDLAEQARRSPAAVRDSRITNASTMTTLPTKYADGGIGVPCSRLSTPLSRSTAIWIASVWNATPNRPVARMPGTKYRANATPPDPSIL